MVNQHSADIRRFSTTPLIASLANPTAIMARASEWAIKRRLRRSQANVRSITQRRRKTLKPPSLSARLTISAARQAHSRALGPFDQANSTIAILNISRNYLEREEVTFGVDEGVGLNAFNFLARIIADRINGDPPCMGRFLSRGAARVLMNALFRECLSYLQRGGDEAGSDKLSTRTAKKGRRSSGGPERLPKTGYRRGPPGRQSGGLAPREL
jgi:hypothetical protein